MTAVVLTVGAWTLLVAGGLQAVLLTLLLVGYRVAGRTVRPTWTVTSVSPWSSARGATLSRGDAALAAASAVAGLGVGGWLLLGGAP